MTRMFITRLTRGKVAIDVHGVRLWQSVFVPLKFFHFARNPFRDEASPVGVPLVEVVGAYPVGVWVTVLADIDRAGSFTAWRVVHVAAIVSHGWFLGDFANSIRKLGQSRFDRVVVGL